MTTHEEEFDCLECGQHIIRFVSYEGQPKICGQCIFMPGWFRDPKLRELLDPGFDMSKVPDHEKPVENTV